MMVLIEQSLLLTSSHLLMDGSRELFTSVRTVCVPTEENQVEVTEEELKRVQRILILMPLCVLTSGN